MTESSSPEEQPERDELPSLDDVLIECQKSLARVSASSSEASKADSEFVRGERPHYVIDGITMKLNAGLQLKKSPRHRGSPRIQLDFNAAPETRSELEFRVESRPVEIVTGAKLEIANLDPLGDDLPVVRLRIWLVDDSGKPVPNYPVVVHFHRAANKKGISFEMTTDINGRRDFFIETDKPKENLKIIGDRDRREVHMRGSGQGHFDDDCYVWASCKRSEDWLAVEEPSTTTDETIESTGLDRTESLPDEIESERIRVRFPRKRQPPEKRRTRKKKKS